MTSRSPLLNASTRMPKWRSVFFALWLTSGIATAQTQSTVEAVDAAVDFFSSVSTRNAVKLNTYLLPEGFSEFMPESSKLLKLDAKAFDALFASPLQINLRLTEIQVQHVGDTAIVTGTRVGSISKPDAAQPEARSAVTMIWSRQTGSWKLHHIHVSNPVTK